MKMLPSYLVISSGDASGGGADGFGWIEITADDLRQCFKAVRE